MAQSFVLYQLWRRHKSIFGQCVTSALSELIAMGQLNVLKGGRVHGFNAFQL